LIHRLRGSTGSREEVERKKSALIPEICGRLK
jgi:hypothetical protein